VSKLFLAALVLAVAFAVTACGRGPEQPSETLPPLATPESAPVSPLQASSTMAFVNKLTMASLIETETSRIAAQKTHNDAVRQFSRTLIAEASGGMRELARLSSGAGVAPPVAPDTGATATIDAVRQADARVIDANYLDAIIATRQAAIDEIERYAQSGDDVHLRAWASASLPALRERLQEADLLRQSVNVRPS
jgi:putative membrane protein